MNDYLGNLAGRALGLTPVVRPRLASIFEPVTASPSSFNAAESSATEDSSSRLDVKAQAPLHDRPPRDDAREHDRMARRLVVEERERPVREPRDTEAPHVTSRSRLIEPRPKPQDVIERQSPPPRTPMLTQPAAALVEPPTPRTPPRQEITSDVAERARQSAMPRPRVEADLPHWKDADRRLTALERRRELRIPQHEFATRPPERERAGRLEGRDRQVEASRIDRAPASPIGHEPARAVHVTIGRVEVRAIVPPEPAPRSRSRAAKAASLSLDDYLKTRSGR